MLAAIVGAGGAAVAVVYAVVIVVSVVAWVKILTKAGYRGWWVLIALVPVVNLVMFLVFAFSEWPVLRRQQPPPPEPAWPPPPGGWSS